ncbi:MAG: peptide-methionine (S)-S-oxide reductase MsrA [Rhodospirillales bacterium]|nr:peptide-methionine (S)-S-oxide reductase MsrA [Rhodospirillales bacterium]
MTEFRVDRSRRFALRLSGLALLGAAVLASAPSRAQEAMVVVPPPALDERRPDATSEIAVLAGGCFWGVQAVYQHVRGVSRAVSGYAGGAKDTAVYGKVTSGRTGHAESVEVTFDPRVVSYGQILQIFFSVAHNPTQLNRQGPDVGTHYRSALFIADPMQRRIAEAYIAQLDQARVFPKKIVTQLNDAAPFYSAEAYHQDYATLHPTNPYIARHDLPKITGLKRMFPASWRSEPVLVGAAGGKVSQ